MVGAGFILLILGGVLGDELTKVKDMDRACPDGYFYAGEAVAADSTKTTRDSIIAKGPTSPVYSCYRIIEEELSLAGSILKCQDMSASGQVASINNDLETNILTSKLFRDHFTEQMTGNLSANGETQELLTSGIELSPGSWTWLGADEPIDLTALTIEGANASTVNCLTLRWENNGNSTDLVFAAAPCTQTFNATLCEVRVYTQTWYVWFYTNWLQLLFFVTMGLLLLTSCCLFQALFFRTGARRQSGVQTVQNQPPPYTPTPQQYTTTENAAAKYKQKGKDILAKVTFYKPKDEEKVKFAEAEA